MYGLSTLRRDGDVIVNVMNTHTTVKTKFLVGPLTLKVEKEVPDIVSSIRKLFHNYIVLHIASFV
jgi:hypothetical protein